MESTTSMPWLSWPQKSRRGQEQAFKWVIDASKTALSIKFPTAYGKTMVANGVLHLLSKRRNIKRALMIVPQEGQHDQYARSCPIDFAEVGMIIDRDVVVLDLRKQSYTVILKTIMQNRGKLIVFITTIQMLQSQVRPGGRDSNRRELLSEIFSEPHALWVFVIDEYHHYGIGKSWSDVFALLPTPKFRLAMSATPYRPGQDEFFGAPDIRITYREAVDEGAVKPLSCHVYEYWIEMDGPNGRMRLTTRQHDALIPNQTPNQAPGAKITPALRYREDYISPLLEIPLDRLIRTRSLDHKWAQAIVYCDNINHAEHVYRLLEKMFSGALRLAIVASAKQYEDKNADVLEAFCPEKGKAPTIDVLVCVGMAGEGLNTIYVTEIIHLNGEKKISNTGNQKKGRASRTLRSAVTGKVMVGHINLDGSSAYRGFPGHSIMDAMEMGNLPEDDDGDGGGNTDDDDEQNLDEDDDPIDEPGNNGGDGGDDDEDEDDLNVLGPPRIPPNAGAFPTMEMGLDGIDTGEQFIIADAIATPGSRIHMDKFSPADLKPDGANHEELMRISAEIITLTKRRSPANREAERQEWRGNIDLATGEAASRACRLLNLDPHIYKGEVKTTINSYRKGLFKGIGVPEASIDQLKQHYNVTAQFEFEMARSNQVPQWLVRAIRT